MTSRSSWVALAFLAACLVCLTSCQHVNAGQPSPQYVNLSYNGGSCQQNGSTGIIDLYQNEPVVFQGAATLSQFQAQFTTCPFSACPVSSPTGAAVNVGQPTGTVGTTYNYSGITINNQQCNNMQGMGVRIKGGP
jgi:hypothetical protein